MILYCINPVRSEYYDGHGVMFDDISMNKLLLAPPELSTYEIPRQTKIISGGSLKGGAFYQSRSSLSSLAFESPSDLEKIEIYGLCQLQINRLDMSPCVKLKELPHGCLQQCKNLTDLILPRFLSQINTGSLTELGITTLSIPETVKIIQSYDSYGNSISNCRNLHTIVWEGNPQITNIGVGAFYQSSLTSFRICKLVVAIGNEAFAGTQIQKFTVDEGNSKYFLDGDCVTNIEKTTLIFYPCGKNGTYTIGLNIKTLGSSSFLYSKLSTVVIQSNVQTLGNLCFGYSSITSISVPPSITYMSARVFDCCSQLQTIDFRPKIEILEHWSFRFCTSLKSISIPNGITTIEDSVFDGCSSIERIEIPSSVISIGSSVFGSINENCDIIFQSGSPFKMKNNLLLSENESIIYSYIGSENEVSITIDRKVKLIRGSAFKNTNLIQLTFDPDSSIETIEEFAFYGTKIGSITIPNSITEIRESCFEECSELSTVYLSSSLTSIQKGAFKNSGLTRIVIPSSVQSIYDEAFYNCKEMNLFSFSESSPSQIQTIGKNCFYGTQFTSIFVPFGCISISPEAFSGSGIQTLTFDPPLQASTKEIPFQAFAFCVGLQTINFCSGIVTIGQSSFEGCTALEVLSFDKSTKRIVYNAFKDCTSIKTVRIPNNSLLEEIEGRAFSGCKNLELFELGKSTNFFFADGALYDKDKKKIILYAISNRNNIFFVPTTVEEISAYAFDGASFLENVNIPNGTIKTIGYGAFRNCISLVHIYLPESITNVDANAFFGCTQLKCGSIEYPKHLFYELIKAGVTEDSLHPCATSLFSVRKEFGAFDILTGYVFFLSE